MDKQYFLEVFENNVFNFIAWRYGEECAPELQEIFEYIEDNYKEQKIFDWKDEEAAQSYKSQMEDQGYKVIDIAAGSDTFCFLSI
jgi:hypothetical protein